MQPGQTKPASSQLQAAHPLSFIKFLLTVPRLFNDRSNAVLLLWIICVFVSCVSHAFVSVHCCLVVTCWERADLVALVGDVYCIFVTFPCGILGQVWYLIVSFPDLYLLSYFVNHPSTSHWAWGVSFLFKTSFPYMSHGMRFPTMWYVRPAKAQTSLRIRAV